MSAPGEPRVASPLTHEGIAQETHGNERKHRPRASAVYGKRGTTPWSQTQNSPRSYLGTIA
eukprot:10219135-Alexandrium_andersonii.AAC.1